MRFANIEAAYLFWVVVALVGFFFWVNAQRQKALENFADKNLLATLLHSFDIRKYRIKQLLLIIVFTLGVFA